MRAPFETQREDLRHRIARSRRRLDRHARFLATNPLRLTRLAAPPVRHAGFWGILLSGIGLLLARRLTRRPDSDSWLHDLLGSAVSAGLEQLLRRLRVLARQASRRTRQTATGDTND